MVLKRNHDYFIQVQGQMAVFEEEYSDFVCWTTKGLHVERIEYSPSIFLQLKPSLDLFFKNAILPELLTHAPKDGNTDKEHQTDNQSDDILYCLCGKGESGRMIACDNVVVWSGSTTNVLALLGSLKESGTVPIVKNNIIIHECILYVMFYPIHDCTCIYKVGKKETVIIKFWQHQ